MKYSSNKMVDLLTKKGVRFILPDNVFINHDVDPERISGKGVVIHPGCRISGSSTLIMEDTELGREAPVTMEDCHVGPGCSIKGGYFIKSVFLKSVSVGSGAHFREGTILEEESSAAHTVGLKQTILFPFVTLGSLINFCDCLMAGGTSRKNHSEVGSSFIHFNYTPNQDKATPSLMGDVPRGVMLQQNPIFLGGQGGLVGPCRLEFGTITAAGTINRKDELRPGRLIIEGSKKGGSVEYDRRIYRGGKNIINNNIIYMGNLIALMEWYKNVRSVFIKGNLEILLHKGLIQTLNMGIDERIKQLGRLADKMKDQGPGLMNKNNLEFSKNMDKIENFIRKFMITNSLGRENMKDEFMKGLEAGIDDHGRNYLQVIKGLSYAVADLGTTWLQGIVDDFLAGYDAINF